MYVDSRAMHSSAIHFQKPEAFRFNDTTSEARGSRLLNCLQQHSRRRLHTRSTRVRRNEKHMQTHGRAHARRIASACRLSAERLRLLPSTKSNVRKVERRAGFRSEYAEVLALSREKRKARRPFDLRITSHAFQKRTCQNISFLGAKTPGRRHARILQNMKSCGLLA